MGYFNINYIYVIIIFNISTISRYQRYFYAEIIISRVKPPADDNNKFFYAQYFCVRHCKHNAFFIAQTFTSHEVVPISMTIPWFLYISFPSMTINPSESYYFTIFCLSFYCIVLCGPTAIIILYWIVLFTYI